MSSARSFAWMNPRIIARLAMVALLGALTAGCFQPLYGERGVAGGSGVREKLAGVEVPPLALPTGSPYQRVGIEVRNNLMFKMYGDAAGAPPTHRLILRMTSSRTSLIVDPNTQLPTSENYGLDVSYGLIDLASGKEVLKGNTFARVTYDIPGSLQRFARARAYRDAEDRGANEIAENINTRLASFFYSGI
ncbi:LPS assembly lipoprotein LptE [soil metagenome]